LAQQAAIDCFIHTQKYFKKTRLLLRTIN